MIVIEVDFNHLDGAGRLVLADLAVHERTPFAEIAVSGSGCSSSMVESSSKGALCRIQSEAGSALPIGQRRIAFAPTLRIALP